MTLSIAILGATGSIGTSTLSVCEQHPELFRVHSVAAARNVEKLADICARFHPARAAIADVSLRGALCDALRTRGCQDIEVLAGEDDVVSLCSDPLADAVLQAVVGAAGVRPTFEAARAGKRILLANKESVVCGGSLLMNLARKSGATILPVDSEHNALLQCLMAEGRNGRKRARLWLTCSGGPFRARRDLDLSTVTPEVALAHPTWSMGRKISIDSATLMNKGLEVIEARHLFDVEPERIRVVVHPQSIVHSMVEYDDGAVIAQMASPDMRLAIGWCMGWPERIPAGVAPLTLDKLNSMTFEEPDLSRFPQLGYAYEALSRQDASCIVLNAANEIAVGLFLDRRLSFTGIAELTRHMMDTLVRPAPASLEEILDIDRESRVRTIEAFSAGAAR